MSSSSASPQHSARTLRDDGTTCRFLVICSGARLSLKLLNRHGEADLHRRNTFLARERLDRPAEIADAVVMLLDSSGNGLPLQGAKAGSGSIRKWSLSMMAA